MLGGSRAVFLSSWDDRLVQALSPWAFEEHVGSSGRDLFLAVLHAWFSRPGPCDSDLVATGIAAIEAGDDDVVVLALGSAVVDVVTRELRTTVTAGEDSLLAERRVTGVLCWLGWGAPEERQLPFFAERGILPVGQVRLRPHNVNRTNPARLTSGSDAPDGPTQDGRPIAEVAEPAVVVDVVERSWSASYDLDSKHAPAAFPTRMWPEPSNSIDPVEPADAICAEPKWDEFDMEDPTDVTMMPEAGLFPRRTLVEVAGTGPVASALVFGVHCQAGHFTDSRLARCMRCGAETDMSTAGMGPRPTLGWIDLDDGRGIHLDRAVLIGRNPTSDAHHEGFATVAYDDDRMLSRVHLEIRLVDWQVMAVDRQSANGVTIEHPDGHTIVARPNLEEPLADGSCVRFGKHTLTFRSRAT